MEVLKNNKNIKGLELLQQQINKEEKILLENGQNSKVKNLQPLIFINLTKEEVEKLLIIIKNNYNLCKVQEILVF